MKLRKTPALAGVLFLAVLLAGALVGQKAGPPGPSSDVLLVPGESCTSILVGKDASVDGSVMTTHTCDCGTCDWTWRHIPAADHKPGSTRRILHISQYKTWPPSEGLKWELVKKDYAGFDIPEVPHTYAYHHGMFGYMNENQVGLGESSIGNQRKMSNPTPSAGFDLTMLTLLAMERAKTAREAIQVMGSLAEKYGYGFHDEGEMLAVSDPDEAWIFEIMPVGPLWTPKSGKPGAVWCAQRVPDDEVSVCPNESRIGEIDLANKDFFMASPNVVSYAVEAGLYDPKAGKPFNWKRAYSPQEGSAASSNGRFQRLWRFFDLVAPSRKFRPETPNMDLPFSVRPDKKVSVEDVMNLTRDRSYGTPFDPVLGIRGGPFKNPNYYRQTRVIDHGLAEYTTVTQSRGSACPLRSAGSSGSPSARRTRTATCRSMPGPRSCRSPSPSATTGPSTAIRPAGPSITSTSTSRSPTTRPSRTSRPPRPDTKARRSPASPRSTSRLWSSTRRSRRRRPSS